MEKKLILGPPGTGKTTHAIGIMRDLLETGVEPEEIAFVSFTKKASDEGRDRCVEQLGLAANRFVYVRTLHSLAFRENNLRRSDVMGWHHYKDLSEESGIDLKAMSDSDNPDDRDSLISFHLGMARNLCRTPEQHWHQIAGSMMDKMFNFGGVDKGGSLRDFLHAHDLLEQYKKRKGLWDFHDMLERGIHAHPINVRFVIIDEAQDLSPLQWRFARAMFKNAEKVWIAGDDDQAVFTWAGADLKTFRNMEAERIVLNQSFRLPRSVHDFSMQLVQMIVNRYEKEFRPRDEEGEFRYVHGLEDCDLMNGESWMLLTRTRPQQYEIKRFLLLHGIPFKQQGKSSIDPDHLRMASTWTKLQRGERVYFGSVATLYENMREDALRPNAKELIREQDYRERVDLDKLKKDFGLLVSEGLWHEVLTIEKSTSDYYAAIKQNFGMDALTKTPQIELNTMHSVKGGEADNVFFSNSMGRKPYGYYKAGFTHDDEGRVFYVAATRARKRLFIRPTNNCPFPLPT